MLWNIAAAAALLLAVAPFAAQRAAPARADAPPAITTSWIASLTQTQAVIYFETDQAAKGYVDYGLTTGLGRVRPLVTPAEETTHSVVLSPLKASTKYYWRLRAENANGQTTTALHSFVTPSSASTGRLVVTNTNSTATIVHIGACYELFTDGGGGALGNFVAAYCDRYDETPNDGKVVFPSLAPGAYVLLEALSPEHYVLVKNRTFSIAAGQTLEITIKDSGGGTRLHVTVRDQDSNLVPGSCFDVFANVNGIGGRYLGSNCDDYDGDDGTTILGSFK
jgi:hypothetical protein